LKTLFEKLEEYEKSSIYPAHMPGHKRQKAGVLPEVFTQADISEVEGFDNLHQARGILEKLQKRAAYLYGADESFYLVNGSTGGILSGISAAIPIGGHLLMVRGAHLSVYHAAYLRQLRLSYIYPDKVSGYSISEGVTTEEVRRALTQYPDASAVLIVSPTYEGRIAQVGAIAEEVHKWGIPLIVDEAHGAHLGFGDGFSENSCRQGADLVVHSVHKTLPALTQSALLHVNGYRIDRNLLRRFLHIYQTTSPSYLLMASIDNALDLMDKEGGIRCKQFILYWESMLEELSHMRKLEILLFPDRRQDIGKLAVFTKKINLSPRQLYDMLLREYNIQVEMVGEDYILAMFTVWDTEEGFRRMTEALLEIDEKMGSPSELNVARCIAKQQAVDVGKSMFCANHTISFANQMNEALPLWKAWDMPWEECKLDQARGKYGADFIGAYPPGIPLLVPGEKFSASLITYIKDTIKRGGQFVGVTEHSGDTTQPTVHILKEEMLSDTAKLVP
jgi:arginine/lysine/ornithine decarboxylase